MKRRLPKSDAAHLVSFGPADGQLGLQVAGGVGRPGFDHHIAGFCFLLFAFLLSVLFSLQFFCPFEFRFWSNDCFVHSPFVEARETSSPLRGGLCLVIGHVFSCQDCFRRRAVLTGSCWGDLPSVLQVGHTLRAMHWPGSSVFGRSTTTLTRCCTVSTHIFYLSFLNSFYGSGRKMIAGFTHMKTAVTLEHQGTTQTKFGLRHLSH